MGRSLGPVGYMPGRKQVEGTFQGTGAQRCEGGTGASLARARGVYVVPAGEGQDLCPEYVPVSVTFQAIFRV